MLKSQKLSLEQRDIRQTNVSERNKKVPGKINVYMNFTANSSDNEEDKQASQEINLDDQEIMSNNPFEVMISTLSKEKLITHSIHAETLSVEEQKPQVPLIQPERGRRKIINPKTLRMIIQKPALININGPPLPDPTTRNHNQLQDKQKPTYWQQVPINLYKNPRLEKTLREFLVKQQKTNEPDFLTQATKIDL